MFKRLSLAAPFLFILFIFQPQIVFACSCVELSTTPSEYVNDKLKSADAVFSGKVLSTDYRKMTETEIKSIADKNSRSYDRYFEGRTDIEIKVIRFEAYRWWKGFDDKEITLLTGFIRTPDGGGIGNSCEVGFEAEKEYLVFAYGKTANSLRSHYCSGTTLLQNTSSYSAFLGAGKAPKN